MPKVYILAEEREDSVACRVHGVWRERKDACKEMLRAVKDNDLFTEESKIDIEEGRAESDPNYCEEEYCNYSINEYSLL